MFSFASEKTIGQTLTMSAPSQVCGGLDFNINLTSTQSGYILLVYSENGINGPWIEESSGKTISTLVSPGVYGVTLPRNIVLSRIYKFYYWANYNDYFNYSRRYVSNNYVELPQSEWKTINLFETPFVNTINITKCGNEQFSVMPTDAGAGGNIVPAGTTYTWSVFSTTSTVTGAVDNNASGNLSITQTVTNGTNTQTTVVYRVLPTSSNGCPGDYFNLNLTLNPAPQIETINGQVCSGSNYQNDFSSISGAIIPTGTTYNWTFTNNLAVNNESAGTSSATSFTQLVSNTLNSTQTVTYSITPNSGSCMGTPFTLNLGVKPKPFVSTQSKSICSNSTFSFSPSNGGVGGNIIPVGTTYTWIYQPNL
ncbi:MAG: hypothetical protein RI940_548, partial [Bacteroidota bacterium]